MKAAWQEGVWSCVQEDVKRGVVTLKMEVSQALRSVWHRIGDVSLEWQKDRQQEDIDDRLKDLYCKIGDEVVHNQALDLPDRLGSACHASIEKAKELLQMRQALMSSEAYPLPLTKEEHA